MKKFLGILARVAIGAGTGAATAAAVGAEQGRLPQPTEIVSGAVSGALGAVFIRKPGDHTRIEELEAQLAHERDLRIAAEKRRSQLEAQ